MKGLAPFLAAFAVGCGLPGPTAPLTRSPDAPFRSARPALLDRGPVVRAPAIRAERLENGLLVVCIPHPELPLVTVEVVVRDAGFLASPSEPGAAMVTAYALAEPPDEYVWSRVTREAAELGMTARSERFNAISETLAAAVENPTFDEATLKLARKYATEEIERLDGNADAITNELLYREAPPTIGSADAGFESVTHGDVVALHRERYRPDRTAFVVAGAVEPEQVVAVAKRIFGSWTLAAPPPAEPALAPAYLVPSLGLRPIAAVDRQTLLAYARFTIPGPPSGHEDLPAFELAATLLGGSVSSRGFKTLRLHDAASYSVGSKVVEHPNGAELVVQFGTEQAAVVDSVRQILAEIERLRQEDLGPGELEGIQAIRQAKLASDLASNAGAAMLLSSRFAAGDDPTAFSRYLADRGAVAPAALRKMARTWLTTDRVQILVVANRREVAAELGSVGGVIWYQ